MRQRWSTGSRWSPCKRSSGCRGRLSHRLARFYTRLLDLAVPRLRRVGLRNLQMAMPSLDRRQRHQIVDGVFRSIARMLVTVREVSANPQAQSRTMDSLRRAGAFRRGENARDGRVVRDRAPGQLGVERVRARADRPARCTWWCGRWINPRIDALVEAHRALSGNRIIRKKDSARAILRALRANEAVGILIDQNTALDEGVFVDFFGVPACAEQGVCPSWPRIAARP